MENIPASKGERAKQIVVVFATVCVIFVNFLAAKGYINDRTPEMISDKYPTFITPAGYAFAIWSLIYLGLLCFSIFQLLPSQINNPRLKNIRTLYVINCAANCGWLFLWHHEWIALSVPIIFVMLGTLVLINAHLQNASSTAENWFTRIPFGIYFGWITIAAILNFSVALVYLNVKTPDSITVIIASALILTAMILGVVIRIKFALAAYALAFAWALAAIAAEQSEKSVIVISAIAAVIVLLICVAAPFLQRKNSYQ